MDLKLIYLSLLLFLIVQRLSELFLSRSNEKYMLRNGAKVGPNKDLIFMILIHTSWLAYCSFYALNKSSWQETPFYIGLALLLIGQLFRLTAILTLGRNWSVKVISVPHFKRVKKGIFKYFRHPNYIGVILEIFALPLMLNSLIAAFVFSLLNGILLNYRIKHEEFFLLKVKQDEGSL